MPEISGQCSHCGGDYSFPAEDLGREILCPHCNKPTLLNVGKMPELKQRPPPRSDKRPVAGILFLLVIGMGLVLSGCVQDAAAKTVMQQLVYTIQYTSGFVLIGLAI